MHPKKLPIIFPICFIILLGFLNEAQGTSCVGIGAGGAPCVNFPLKVGHKQLFFPAGVCSLRTKKDPWCAIDEAAAATNEKPSDYAPKDKGITWDVCNITC